MAIKSKVIIGRYDPEILLKSKPVRLILSRRLVETLKKRLKLGGFGLKVHRGWDKFSLNLPPKYSPAKLEKVIDIITTTFGVNKIFTAQAYKFQSLDQLEELFKKYYLPLVKSKTFGVRVRLNNRPEFKSQKLEADLAGLVYDQSQGVNLTRPDLWIRIWLEKDNFYFIDTQINGVNGYPLASSDPALALFSGGIDSPVAAWLAARKGLALNFFLLNQAGRQQFKLVYQLIKSFYRRWLYPSDSWFYIYPGEKVRQLISQRIEPRLRSLIFKRILTKISYYICQKEKINILVSGESLNQVSSQTPSNLKTVQSPIPNNLLLIRPLIGWTKNEVINQARKIATLSISEKIPEYCLKSKTGSATQFSLIKMAEVEKEIGDDIQNMLSHLKYEKINLKEELLD